MARQAITVMFQGQPRTLYELAEITGIKYHTLYRRFRHGADLFATMNRDLPRCTATHSSECLNCLHDDCIRTNCQGWLEDERTSSYVW